MKINQKGFSAVVILLALLLIVAIGFTGYYVWNTQQNKKTASAETKTVAVVTPQKTTTNPTPATQDTQKYLVVKEWGIKIPVDDSVDGLSYTLFGQKNTDGIRLSTTALKQISGTCTDNEFLVFRGKANDIVPAEIDDPQNPSFLQTYNSLTVDANNPTQRSFKLKIGDYYYTPPGFAGASCVGSSQSGQAKEGAISLSIAKAVQNAKAN